MARLRISAARKPQFLCHTRLSGTPRRECQPSTAAAVAGGEPSSAITTSKPRSLWRDNAHKTASSASSRSYVATMTEMRSGTSELLRFVLHEARPCDNVPHGRAQQRGSMQKISAYILAFNEAEKITDAV